MLPVLHKIEKIIMTIGFVSAMIFLPIMVLGRTYEIIARKVATAPSGLLQAFESESFFFLVFLSLGYAYLTDSHVRIDILRDKWGPRTRAWVEIAGFVVFMLPFGIVVIWYGLDFVALSYGHGERLGFALGGPWRWLMKAALPFGVCLLLIAMASKCLRALAAAQHGKLPE